MCTLITSKATDIDENIANQNHATRTRTPKPGYLNLSNSELRTLTGSKFDVINQSTFLTQSFDVTHAVRVVKNVACLSPPSTFDVNQSLRSICLRRSACEAQKAAGNPFCNEIFVGWWENIDWLTC